MAIEEVTVDELADQLAAGARLIDVREPAEFDGAHVEGAVLVPLQTVPERIDAFLGGGTSYVICHSGVRSLAACEFAAQHGASAANVAGGMVAWLASGREIATGDV